MNDNMNQQNMPNNNGNGQYGPQPQYPNNGNWNNNQPMMDNNYNNGQYNQQPQNPNNGNFNNNQPMMDNNYNNGQYNQQPQYPNNGNWNNNQPMMNNNYNNGQYNQQPQYPNNGNWNNNQPSEKKKPYLLIGIIAACVVVCLVVVIILLPKNSENSGSNSKSSKTLTCSRHTAIGGYYADQTYIYYIKDGGLSAKQTIKYDLAKMSSGVEGGTIDEWAEQMISESKSDCAAEPGCKVEKVNHSKGKSLEITISLSQEYLTDGTDISDKTAEEMYNKLKAGMEEDTAIGALYTCK